MTQEFWKKWKEKPWVLEQCRDRYVRGLTISIAALSVESGVVKRTLERWSKREDWVEQRRQYQALMSASTDQKSIEKTSEKLSDEISLLATEHFKAHKSVRRLAEIYLNFTTTRIEQKLENVKSNPEYLEAELKSISPVVLNFWSLILDRSVKGERVAIGMDYEDVNKAIATLTSLGYVITDPTAQQNATLTQESTETIGFSDIQFEQVRASILGVDESSHPPSFTPVSTEVDP
ncbi:MAG: hypothetical protein ACRCZS_13300 [Chroococcidiopsis sp.]